MVSLCVGYTLDSEMGKKQAPKVLWFLPLINFIYYWVNREILGTPLSVNSRFLRSLREENLITPKGKYAEDYILEVLDVKKRVCYVNHGSSSN